MATIVNGMLQNLSPYRETTVRAETATVVYMTTRRGRPLKEPEGDLPNRMRALRVGQGLSQEALAERLGWDKRTISRLESGERHLKVADLPAIARALRCKPRDLLPDALPEEDEHLLDLFHRLPQDDRERLLAVADSFAAAADARRDASDRPSEVA